MKYVYNKGRYALSFDVKVKGRRLAVVLDRKRVFMDTGNIATTGVTEVAEDVYSVLSENLRFKKLIASGELELTEAPSKVSDSDSEALKAENKKLKEALKKAEANSTNKEAKATIKAKDEEIKTLKAQIEALTEGKKAESETEGF